MTDIETLIKTAILLESKISELKSQTQELNKELSTTKHSIYNYLICTANVEKIAVILNGKTYLIIVDPIEITISLVPTLKIDI